MAGGGWTARGLARQLTAAGTPVTAATLSAWRRGESAPAHPAGTPALAMAEILLDLPAGDLALPLAPHVRRLRPVSPLALHTGRTDTTAAAAALTGSRLPATAAAAIGRQPLAIVAVAWHNHVGGDGHLAHSQLLVAIRALDDPVGGYWLIHHDTGGDPPPEWARRAGKPHPHRPQRPARHRRRRNQLPTLADPRRLPPVHRHPWAHPQRDQPHRSSREPNPLPRLRATGAGRPGQPPPDLPHPTPPGRDHLRR
jgi:hypothetical protein